jgi:hypothetical protein
MRHPTAKLILALLIAFACARPALLAATDNPPSQFTGTWEGKMNDQPAVAITLATGGGKVGGTIVFYFQRLGKDGKWHVEGDNRAQPLIDPRIDGNILSFEVLHHKQHGSAELGPNKKFRLEVTGANEARLREAGKPDDMPGHGLKLVRRMSR